MPVERNAAPILTKALAWYREMERTWRERREEDGVPVRIRLGLGSGGRTDWTATLMARRGRWRRLLRLTRPWPEDDERYDGRRGLLLGWLLLAAMLAGCVYMIAAAWSSGEYLEAAAFGGGLVCAIAFFRPVVRPRPRVPRREKRRPEDHFGGRH
ncbi:MAG: hypothetical protein ACE5JG_03270 [Planctomycetota bacterium]